MAENGTDACLPVERPARPRREGPPFYTTTPEAQRDYARIKRLVDWFGTHMICPLKTCRRAGRCGDDDRAHLPFCFDLYRGQIRFALELAGALAGLRREGAPSEAEEFASRAGLSVLEIFDRSGIPIDGLRRPIDAGQDDYTWEQDEAARAMLARYRAIGDERARRRKDNLSNDRV